MKGGGFVGGSGPMTVGVVGDPPGADPGDGEGELEEVRVVGEDDGSAGSDLRESDHDRPGSGGEGVGCGNPSRKGIEGIKHRCII